MKNTMAVLICCASTVAASIAVLKGLNAKWVLSSLMLVWLAVQYWLWPQGLQMLHKSLPQIYTHMRRSPVPPLAATISTGTFLMCVGL